MTKGSAAPKDGALPDLSGEDESASEPTKVGDGANALAESIRASLATPHERATSKMSAFQLADVLERLGEGPPERSQARMKAPSEPPALAPEGERPAVPAEPLIRAMAPAETPRERRGVASIVTFVFAAVFIALTCAVLFGR